MGVVWLCLCLTAVVLLPGLDARNVKLVPTETKTVTTNGATHEISRYVVVPDDETNDPIDDDITNKKIRLKITNAIKNEVTNGDLSDTKLFLKITPGASDGDNVNSEIIYATTIKPEHFKAVNALGLDNVYNKPIMAALPAVNIEESSEEFKKHLKFGNEVKTADHSSSEDNAGDHNNPGHFKTKTTTKTIYNPTKVTNIKFKQLPIKWDDGFYTESVDSEKGYHPLLSSIDINKTFTLPGKRGRFKIIHEDDDDIDTVIEKPTLEHSTTTPLTQTTTHYYIDKYYVDNSRKTIPQVDESTDTSSRTVTIKTNDYNGDIKSLLKKTNLDTNTETENQRSAVELTSEKTNLISSTPLDINSEDNKPNSVYPLVGFTKSRTDSSTNMETNGSQKLTLKTSKVISNFSPDRNIKDRGPNPGRTLKGLLNYTFPKIENNASMILTRNKTNFDSNTLSKDYFADIKPNTHHTIEVTKLVTKNTNEEPILNNTNAVNIPFYKSIKEPTKQNTEFISSAVSNSDIEEIEPKRKQTNILVAEPSPSIDDNIEALLLNNDHANVVSTNFLLNRFGIAPVQENSETNSMITSKNDDKNLKPTSSINIIKLTDFTPDNRNFEVIPLQHNTGINDSSKIEMIEIVPTVNTTYTKTTVVTTSGIKHEGPSSDGMINVSLLENNNDAASVPKLVSQINEIEIVPNVENNFHGNSIVTKTGYPHEESSTHDLIHIDSLNNNKKVNIPTLDSQIIKIELAPIADKTNTITTIKEKINEVPSIDGIHKHQNKMASQKLHSPLNEIQIVPAVNETTHIVTKNGSKHEVPLANDIINISLLETQNKAAKPKLATDVHKIEIAPRIDIGNVKTKVVTMHGSANENKLEIIPTVGETIFRNELPKKDDVNNIEFLLNGYKVTVPKMEIGKPVTGSINENENDYINTIKSQKKGSLFDFNLSVPITKNSHEAVKPTRNHEYLLNYLGTRHGNNNKVKTEEHSKTINVSGDENLRVIDVSYPIKQNVDQTDITKNSSISKDETIIATEVNDVDINLNSATETYKTESNWDNFKFTNNDFSPHSVLKNNINTNVETSKDQANIPTFILEQGNINIPASEHTDTFTNALPETNNKSAQMEITMDETKQLIEEHEKYMKPRNKIQNLVPQSNNSEIKFRLGNPHTKPLPTNATNSEKVDDLDSNNLNNLNDSDEIEENPMHLEQFENVSASKTMTSDEDNYVSYENDVAQVRKYMEDSSEVSGAYPYEGEESRSSRITYREEIVDSQAESADINNNVNIPIENIEPHYDPLRSNTVGSSYPLYTTNYQMYPYQAFTGQSQSTDANYQNVQQFRNDQPIDGQYLQYILNYLTSSSLIAELNAQFSSVGQGVERSEYIMQAIVTYLQKLGIHEHLSQEQLQYLTEQVQQHETINFKKNNNHKIEIIYEIDDQPNVIAPPNQMAVPNQYYLIPYNNVYTPGAATNQNMGLVQDNVYQHYLQEGFNVNIVNNALTTRVLNYITILRNHRVPEFQILQFVVEVKKYLTTEVLQTFMADCQTKAYFSLTQRIEMIAKQFLPRGIRTPY